MSKPTVLLALLMLLAVAAPVLADGKFYTYEEIPPEIPYQRALLAFARGQETLVLQSKYQVAGSPAGDLGWVVPVPSIPDLDSMPADTAEVLFGQLDEVSRPKETRIGTVLLAALVLLLLAGLPALLFVGLQSLLLRRIRPTRRQWGLLFGWAIVGFLVFVTVWVFEPYSARSAHRGSTGVEVVKAEQVGIYDVQVIRSDDAAALLDWLDRHQFKFDEADTQVFDEYLRQGWVFVVARIDPSAAQAGRETVFEGLVAPLILHFQAETPVYPLALTATAGQPTLILLYLLGEGKWESDGRLDLHFAGELPSWLFSPRRILVEPEAFFGDEEGAFPILCKFKGTLAPEEMRQDLTFTLAENNRPYRKWVVRW